MKAILAAGAALLATATVGSTDKPKRVRKPKAKTPPVVATPTKTPGVKFNPNWKRRPAGQADWKIPYLAAWSMRGKVADLTRPDKRDLQAAKKMAMKERRMGGAAAVRSVVVTEV